MQPFFESKNLGGDALSDSNSKPATEGFIKGQIQELMNSLATKEDINKLEDKINRLERRFEDFKTSTDTRFAALTMRESMGGNAYTSLPRVTSGHAMSESPNDYRRMKSQGR